MHSFLQLTPNAKRLEPLAVDAANGVGAVKLAYMRQTLAKYLPIEIFNDGTKGRLNEQVPFSWKWVRENSLV